jgi:hypothetical protein
LKLGLSQRLRVLENRVPRRKDEETRSRENMHSEELRDLYTLPHIRIIRSRRMKWAGHKIRVGEKCMESFGRRSWRKGNTRNIGVEERIC